MAKGIEHSHDEKKRAQFTLKEKRARKMEKRAAKHTHTITPESLQ